MVETARAVAEAGADAVVVGNAVPAAMPDGRPGGLSGPAIRPLALRCVSRGAPALPARRYRLRRRAWTRRRRAYLDAGASAVQVGTALFHDPTTAAPHRGRLAPEPDQDA